MNESAVSKSLRKTWVLFITTLSLILITFYLAAKYAGKLDDRVNFDLIDHLGKQVSEKNFAGRYKFVFFGFTSCQNVCPTQMRKLTQVLYTLDKTEQASKVHPLFMTVDPERDTPEKIADYLSNFDSRIIGLTGSRPALESAAKTFKTFLAKVPDTTQRAYQIPHSTMIYIVDPFSRVIGFISNDMGVDEMVEEIQSYL